MINPNVCPLCGCTAPPNKLSENKNHRLVECDTYGNFVISCEAEEALVVSVIEKANMCMKLENLSDDKMLHIFMDGNKLAGDIIDGTNWFLLK